MKTHASLFCLGSKFDVRRLALSAVALVVFGLAPAALFAATTINVTVPATAGPWHGIMNAGFAYTSSNDYTAPIAVSSASGFTFTAGSAITVTYVSGTVSAGFGYPFRDANGDPNNLTNNAGPGGSNGAFPAFYMNPLVPVYGQALVGAFTNNGMIVGQPFLIGNGPTTLTVPAGANQLQLGINDNLYSDNAGSFTVDVSEGGVSPPPPNPAQTYDAVAQFSKLSNPNGPWAYGWKTSPVAAFMLNTTQDSTTFGPGVDMWNGPDNCGFPTFFPAVAFNNTGARHDYAGGISQPVNMLNLIPSCSPKYSVVRWTAPTTGSFKVTGSFQPIDTRGTSSDAHIVLNSTTSLFNAQINGTMAPFDLIRHLAAGETLDFAVGVGPNSFSNDSTGLALTITAVDSIGPATTGVALTPNPVAVNEPVVLAANIDDTDTGLSNIHSAEYSIDGGPFTAMSGDFGTSPAITVGAVIPPFSDPGVYSVCVHGTDAAGNVGPEYCVPLAVYDPDGGFVTGGGWILSSPGAYTPNPNVGGKATFGFVSKYVHGANNPTGDTQFIFHAGGFRFQSASYDWLVVAGARAKYKGVGSVNGQPGFRFLLSAIDGNLLGGGGSSDALRLKVEDQDGNVIYDNQMGAAEGDDPVTALGGGSIVIHKP